MVVRHRRISACFVSRYLMGVSRLRQHCRRLAGLSFAHARVERDTSGSTKMLKAHRRQRDDVAQASVLAVASAARMPAARRARMHVA